MAGLANYETKGRTLRVQLKMLIAKALKDDELESRPAGHSVAPAAKLTSEPDHSLQAAQEYSNDSISDTERQA